MMASITRFKKSMRTCSICGDETQLIISDISEIKTAHTGIPVNLILERLYTKIEQNHFKYFEDSKKFNKSACQDCLIKIDEYDLAWAMMERIENELINSVLKSSENKQKSEKNTSIIFKKEDKDFDFFKMYEDFNEEQRKDIIQRCDLKISDLSNNISSQSDDNTQHFNDIIIDETNDYDVGFDSMEEIKNDEISQTATQMTKHKTVELSGFIRMPTTYECQECKKEYHTKAEFRKHQKEHKELEHKCKECGKTFVNEILLDIHRAVHEGRSELECSKCSKVLSSKGAMVKHYRVHLQEYKFQCEICGKQFVHDTSFRMHIFAHNNIRNVSCKICHRQFRCTPHLNRHMRVHTGEKPFVCPVCGRKFAQRYNMNMHHKSHSTNGGEFKCSVCEKSYNVKKRLYEHLKVVHNTIIEIKNDNILKHAKRTPVYDKVPETETIEVVISENNVIKVHQTQIL